MVDAIINGIIEPVCQKAVRRQFSFYQMAKEIFVPSRPGC